MNTAAQSGNLAVPATMRAWVLDDPGQLRLAEKPVPQPGPAEVLVRVDAIAFCDGDMKSLRTGRRH